MTDEEKKIQEDNKKRILLAIALSLGMADGLDLSKISSYDDLPGDIKDKAIKAYQSSNIDKSAETVQSLSKEDVLKIAAIAAYVENKTQYFKIVTTGDERVCDYCRKWQDKIVTLNGEDPRYKSLNDFLNSNGTHFGCRCQIVPVSPKKPNSKELNNMAINSESITDQIVYRGFVDEALDPDITYDFDETLVMICPTGEFVGSNSEGKPTKEIVDAESMKIICQQTEEILLDRDHASQRNTLDRDTEAMGWISGLKCIDNLGEMNGIYGIIRWTDAGKQLVIDRSYRFLSPVFQLNAENKAVKLVSVALTNRPAIKMSPILNSEPSDENISITDQKKDTDSMNKDEIKTMIAEMVKEAVALNSEAKEQKTETVCAEEVKEETKTEKVEVENECEQKEEVKNDEGKREDTVEVAVETDKVDSETEEVKEEDKEVIKQEALNSAPMATISLEPKWKNLRGKEFFDWIKAHKNEL